MSRDTANSNPVKSSFRRRPESMALKTLDSGLRRNDGLVIYRRHGSPCLQRGAAALIATVFLLLVIAVLGGIGLRLTSTDIRDTALQNDSIEALFLAESGVERALQRLAAGTPCNSVAQPGTIIPLGRGDFEVQTSVWNAGTGWCDVSILGRVLLAGSVTAQRQIDVSLKPGSPISAWVVGDNGAIYSWSGSTWTVTTSNTTEQLNAAHCVNATDCWAVGDKGVIRHWTGSNWATTASGTNEDLVGVSCIVSNPAACYAVGKDVVRRWNGSTWVDSTFTGGELTAISCTSSTCYSTEDKDVIWRLNTATNIWVVDVTLNGDKWNAIHCLPGGECWVAGDKSGGDFRLARLLSGSWSTFSYNQNPAKDLFGIHCVASDTCWAVGEKRSGGLDYIIRRSSGSFSYTEPTGGNDLHAIACSAVNNCLAVGDKGDVQRWDGSGWAQAMSGMPNVDLYGIAMPSGGGAVQLMRWSERIL